MSKNSIKNNENLAKNIKLRRQELNMTIEEAAAKASVGTKTWSRYESGNPIRQDKIKGLLKSLKWKSLPSEGNNNEYELLNKYDYKKHTSWSENLCENYGEMAAISFCIGSDLIYDYIKDDLESLSNLPKDYHIGQLEYSFLKYSLPQRYLTKYNYEFIYELKLLLKTLIEKVKYDDSYLAHKPIEEILFFLIAEEAELLMEEYINDSSIDNYYDKNWIYDIFGDMDVYTFLYSEVISPHNSSYDFKNWFNDTFWIDE